MGAGGEEKVYRPPPKPRGEGEGGPRRPAQRHRLFVRKAEGEESAPWPWERAVESGLARAAARP